MKSIKRDTADQFLGLLGFQHYPHAARSVLVSALDGLSAEAKRDLTQYLADQPAATETVCTCAHRATRQTARLGERPRPRPRAPLSEA